MGFWIKAILATRLKIQKVFGFNLRCEIGVKKVELGCFHRLMSTSQVKEDIVLILTTPSIEGATITDYHGIVSGEAILGANIFKDLFASVRDIVGGRSAAYEDELRKAKDLAIEEMTTQASRMGANAVVGVDLDYETIGGGKMLMVSASGTAVTYAT